MITVLQRSNASNLQTNKKKPQSLSLGSLGCLDKINYIDSRRLTSLSTNPRPWRFASLLKTSVPSPPVQRLLLLPVDVAPGRLKELVQKTEMVDSCALKSRSRRWFNGDLRLCIMLIMIGHISSTSILHCWNTYFHFQKAPRGHTLFGLIDHSEHQSGKGDICYICIPWERQD